MGGGRTYQSRVDEADCLLAHGKSFLIDTVQNSGKNRRSGRRATNKSRGASIENDDVVANGRDVRVATPGFIVDAAVGTNVAIVDAGIVRILRAGGGKVRGDSAGLVARDGVDVGEAAAGGEAGDGDFLVFGHVAAGRKEGGTRDGEEGARGGEVWGEDGAVADTTVGVVFAGGTGHAGVAGRDDDGDALHAEFHVLIALALLVGCG